MDANNIVFKAATTASLAHQSQSFGSHPFVFHLSMVVAVLQEFGVTDEEVLAAGWLHDIVEDTDYTHELVKALFGERVAIMVDACTGTGRNRKARNAMIREKLTAEEAPSDAALVKAADRIANTRHCIWTDDSRLGMYAKEMVAFTSMLDEAAQNLESGPAATLVRMSAELKRLA